MNKFTTFTVGLVALIVISFTGLIMYDKQKTAMDEKKNAEEQIEHVQTLVAGEKETADKAKASVKGKDKETQVTKSGDTVVIDYVGVSGNEEFDGGTADDYELELGSGSFIPGFEDQLIDHKIGDVVEVEVTFPETYSTPELAGKDAVFVTTIKDIK